MLKPNDFFLGITELFAVIFPGFLVLIGFYLIFNGQPFEQEITNGMWLILIITSYLVGCVFFAIGSKLDTIYEKIKPTGNEDKLATIDKIRKEHWNIIAFTNVNNYKWSRSILQRLHPVGWAEVFRKEVDSKLFRSLVIPLLIFTCLTLLKSNYAISCISFLMSIISFIRYRDLRFKACRAAYEHVIVLYSLNLINAELKNS